MRALKEYDNISLSYYDRQYYVCIEDVVIKYFHTYKEALNYYSALCSLKPGGGYPSPLSEQFEMEDYDSSND